MDKNDMFNQAPERSAYGSWRTAFAVIAFLGVVAAGYCYFGGDDHPLRIEGAGPTSQGR